MADMLPQAWIVIGFTTAAASTLGLVGLLTLKDKRDKRTRGEDGMASSYMEKLGLGSDMTWRELAQFCLIHPKCGVAAKTSNPEVLKLEKEVREGIAKGDLNEEQLHRIDYTTAYAGGKDVEVLQALRDFTKAGINSAHIPGALDSFAKLNADEPREDHRKVWRRVFDPAEQPPVPAEPVKDLEF